MKLGERVGAEIFAVIEEQAYKSCLGLQLIKKYDSERLETACTKAAELGGFQYTTIQEQIRQLTRLALGFMKTTI